MQPKKSLGQNFLRDEKVLSEIIRAANLNPDDNVLEIGPGEGALTKELVKITRNLIMIEKDERLAEKLARNFQYPIINFQSISNEPILNFKNKATIITGDVLEINLPEIIEKNDFQKYKVVANIPYYITSPIIRLFLETKYPPEEMILMVQREVAERICAVAGQMSILSVSVQYYAKPEILFYVDKKSFWPVPDVDSAVIRIIPTEKIPDKKETADFFRTVKAGFGAKRKTLANNLSSSLQLDKKSAEGKLAEAGLAPTARAQELSLKDWEGLSRKLRA